MNEKEAIDILREIKKENESKAMIIHNNSSNIQIRWSNEDLKNMAKISHKCANENRAIEIVLNLIEKQQAEIERLTTNNEILQGELDKIGVKTLKLEVGSSTDDIIAEIEKKDKIIDKLAFSLADYIMYYDYDKCRNPEMIKNKAKEEIEYFTQKIEKGE